jgi:hypothetical protein
MVTFFANCFSKVRFSRMNRNYYRRKRAKNGAPSAITDTAHKLARIVYHLVKTGKQFDESVFNVQEEDHQKRALASLNKREKTWCFN